MTFAKTWEEVYKRLSAPFPEAMIKWYAGVFNKDRTKALPLAYIDARDVMDRLDEVLGPGGWTTTFREDLAGRTVICRLALRLNGVEVWREDVGEESDQKEEGNRRKAAFSNALKRAAVQFGIGRYIYHILGEWTPIDAYGRFTQPIRWRFQPGYAPEYEQPAAAPPREDVPIRQETRRDIERYIQLCDINDEQFLEGLRQMKIDPEQITEAQAQEVLKRLQRKHSKLAQEKAGTP